MRRPLLLGWLFLTACTGVNDGVRLFGTRRDFNIDPLRNYRGVSLKEILNHPLSYLDTDIRFRAVFNRWGENIFIPLYTPFREDRYISFSVWPEDTPLWTAEGQKQSLPTLFVVKNNQYMKQMAAVEPFCVVIVRGRIQGAFANLPWIEVDHMEAITAPVTQPLALKLFDEGLSQAFQENTTAADKIRKALTLGLPREGAFRAHMTLCSMDLAAHQGPAARQHAEQALRIKPRHEEALSLLGRVERLERGQQIREETREPEDPSARDAELKAKTEQLEVLRKLATEQSGTIERLQKELLQAKTEDTNKNLEETFSQLAAAKRHIADQDVRLTEYEKAYGEGSRTIDALEMEISRLKQELAAARPPAGEGSDEMKKALDKALQDLSASEKRNQERETTIREFSERLRVLQTQKSEEIEAKIRKEYQEQIEKRDRIIESLKKQIEELTEREEE